MAVLREAGLKLLVSDKEGGFVVMPRGIYKDKAHVAILHNFKEVQGVPPVKTPKPALNSSFLRHHLLQHRCQLLQFLLQ
ncbi:hypothetical protein HPB50_019297 [Hyalomma asiaticum]|uniref:Uncharacterized protein n=1 Tax=Hyalomma asiaticum TaxID=266040 RepID=A0ACB7TN15_HYAAI|nr:hypothetical protein HPB50_019297 [Hyalomma asiaticum]